MQKKQYLCSVLGKCCIWVCVAVCLFTGCSRRALHEAQAVVKAADSARAEGRMYGTETEDSIALAQAYHTLNNHPLSPYTLHLTPCTAHHTPYTLHRTPYTVHLSSYYVRACYHYGRLLREKDDPVAAMQCFINATHARSRDYHILGRVYSNMGSICHLAGEFPLSYDMYSRSADMFLRNGDTLLYYYGLNSMAYELAEQGKVENTLSLISEIEKQSEDEYVLLKTLETKAELYRITEQYDSTIFYINILQSRGNNESFGYVIKAQSFDNIGMSDSALYYAKLVLNGTGANNLDRYNMFYITSHYDSTINNEEILKQTSLRADIGICIDNQHSKQAQAVQLLEQDLNKKPDLRWIYTLVGILLFTIASVSFVIMWRKRKQHKHLIQDIHIKEQMQTQLASHIDSLSDMQKSHQHQILADIEETCRLIRSCEDIKTQLCWNDYTKMCEMVNARLYGLASKLQANPEITTNDIRLCILVLLNLSYDKIADMLNLSPKSIAKLKSLTAHKLGTTMKNMHDKLTQIACQGNEK